MPEEICARCKSPSVLYQQYSGRHLCAVHLASDVLVRIKRSIRLDGGLGKRSVLVVLWEGCACLCLLSLLGQIIKERPGMELVLLRYADSRYEFPGALAPLSSSVRIRTEHMKGEPIQDVVLRTGADRLIRCITRDEAAEEVIDALLSGRCRELLSDSDLSPVISLSPLREIPCEELRLVAEHLNIPPPSTGESGDTHDFLASLVRNHPSVPFSLIRYKDRLGDLARQGRMQ